MAAPQLKCSEPPEQAPFAECRHCGGSSFQCRPGVGKERRLVCTMNKCRRALARWYPGMKSWRPFGPNVVMVG